MKTSVVSRLVITLCVALAPAFLPGQIGDSSTPPADAPPAAKAMVAASEYRGALTHEVFAGREKPAAVLGQLRGRSNAMGLGFGADTDFAMAALDIGQRLIALGKPEEAEPFFKEAEAAFGLAIDKTPDTAASAKARLLEQRAFIRDNYLNKTPEADADLEKAIALLPDEGRLKRQRDLLPAGKTGRTDKQSKGK